MASIAPPLGDELVPYTSTVSGREVIRVCTTARVSTHRHRRRLLVSENARRLQAASGISSARRSALVSRYACRVNRVVECSRIFTRDK